MLLAIDIGNTQIVIGLIEGNLENPRSVEKNILHNWRLGTSHQRTEDEYTALITSLFQQANLRFEQISGVSLCCVVPNLLQAFIDLVQRLFHCSPVVVGPGTKTGMPILYEHPREVGADRIVNAIAAFERSQQAAIVVDFGTATTFDVVTENGEYAGGVIAPGLVISAEALFHRASKLPRVDITKPDRVVGRNTVGSIQSGLYFGYRGLVDGIVQQILQETRLERTQTTILATGGLAPLMVKDSKSIDLIVPHLTLEGLAIVFYRNQNSN